MYYQMKTSWFKNNPIYQDMHTSIHIVIHVYTGSERKIRRLLIKMLNHLLVISRDLISFTLNNNLMKQCMHFIFRKEENEKMNMLVTQSCPTLRPCRLLPTRLLWSKGFSRQEYWSGCYALLRAQEGSNLRLLHLLNWQAGSLPLAPSGSTH